MFSNRFNTKNDPLVGAVEQALQEGAMRREAEAIVNEAFGVYSRNAVVREDLADYDAAVEEVFADLKEGLDPVGKEDADVDNDGKKGTKSDKYLLNRRKAIGNAMGKRMEEESNWEGEGAARGRQKAAAYAMRKTPVGKRPRDPEELRKELNNYIPQSDSQKAAYDPRVQKMVKSIHKKMEEDYQIDEVSKGKAIRAYAASQDPEGEYSGIKPETGERLKAHIVRKFGKKAGEHAERHADAEHYGRGGKFQKGDSLARASTSRRITKSGKVHGQDVASKKHEVKSRLGKHTKANLPEDFEQFDEGYGSKPKVTIRSGGRIPRVGLSSAEKAKNAAAMPDVRTPEGSKKLDDYSNAVLSMMKRNRRNEEFEQLDELKKEGKLKAYHQKAVAKLHTGEEPGEKREKGRLMAGRKRFGGDILGIPKARVMGTNEETQMDEAAYSAKAARAGEDIGKPGKQFKKIVTKAGKRYGSKERGEKVAGAILSKIRAKHMREETLEELSAFGSAFAAARKGGQSQFSFGGKSYNTKLASSTPKSSAPIRSPEQKQAAKDASTIRATKSAVANPTVGAPNASGGVTQATSKPFGAGGAAERGAASVSTAASGTSPATRKEVGVGTGTSAVRDTVKSNISAMKAGQAQAASDAKNVRAGNSGQTNATVTNTDSKGNTTSAAKPEGGVWNSIKQAVYDKTGIGSDNRGAAERGMGSVSSASTGTGGKSVGTGSASTEIKDRTGVDVNKVPSSTGGTSGLPKTPLNKTMNECVEINGNTYRII